MWTTTGPSAPRASASAARRSGIVRARITRAPRLSAFAARSTGSASAGWGGAVPPGGAGGGVGGQRAVRAVPVERAKAGRPDRPRERADRRVAVVVDEHDHDRD